MVEYNSLSEFDKLGLMWASGQARRSLCLSRKVGAVIARAGVIAEGYNKPPFQLVSCTAHGSCCDNSRGQCTRCRHAEIWAIEMYITNGDDIAIYITCPPCHSCALEIIARGIMRVVCYAHHKSDDEAIARLIEAGVKVVLVEAP